MVVKLESKWVQSKVCLTELPKVDSLANSMVPKMECSWDSSKVHWRVHSTALMKVEVGTK